MNSPSLVFHELLRPTLDQIVLDAKGAYGLQDYPFDQRERLDAGNVRAALKILGYDVSLSDAAAIWEEFSLDLQAGWLEGADTEKGALEGIIMLCQSRLRGVR